MDAVTQARLAEVHPVLSKRIADTVNDCEAVGIYIRVTRGKCSPNEQHALYMQGRANLDIVNDLRKAVGMAPIAAGANKVVTNADYLDSMHTYGLAVDVAPSQDGLMQPFNPDWKEEDDKWAQVLQIAGVHQLAEGAKWTSVLRDYPHLYPVELAANPTDEMKQTLKDAGLQSVWAGLPFN